MIIDFHTHTFPGKIAASTLKVLSGKSHSLPFTEGTREGLISSMEEYGIDKSIEFAVATSPTQVSKLNDIAVSEVKKEGKLITFGSIHPDFAEPEAELHRIARAGVLGIKVHPVYQGCNLSDEKYIRIFKACRDLGLIVTTHAGEDIGYPGVDICGPAESYRVMDKVPGLKLVLAHMGGWRRWREVRNVLMGCPVYLDTAFSLGKIVPVPGESYYTEKELDLMDPDEFKDTIYTFGPDRVLFGTDSPWADQGDALDSIRALNLPGEDENNILGANAERLLSSVNVPL